METKASWGTDHWDLYRDGLTQSMIKSFMTCPEKFRLGTVELLSTGVGKTTGALDFGTLFHLVNERVYGEFKSLDHSEDYPEMIKTRVKATVQESYDKEIIAMRQSIPGIGQYEAVTAVHSLVEMLAYEYFEYHQADFQGMHWEALEQVFCIQYTTKRGNVIPLRGKMDGVFTSNGLYLFETKTKGRIDLGSIGDLLMFDFQVFLYLLAIETMYEKVPKGVLYNIIRRPNLKKKANDTHLDYVNRVREDVQKDPENYFPRIPCVVTQSERSKWRDELDSILESIEAWYWKEGMQFRNSTACQTQYGTCPYLRMCSRDDMTNYRKRDGLFLELEESE